MSVLTKKQKAVLDYISEYIGRHGVSPTQIEIQKKFKFKSLGSVQDYKRYLTEKGYLTGGKFATRGIGIKEKCSACGRQE